MNKVCPVCKKEFKAVSNKKYCCEACRKKAYKYYNTCPEENYEKYRDKIMEQEGLEDVAAFNYYFRERTAENKGMTTTEYNAYLEEKKARKLGLTVRELRHATYIAKRDCLKLYEVLEMDMIEYKSRLKRP